MFIGEIKNQILNRDLVFILREGGGVGDEVG